MSAMRHPEAQLSIETEAALAYLRARRRGLSVADATRIVARDYFGSDTVAARIALARAVQLTS